MTEACKAIGGTCRDPGDPRPANEIEQDVECDDGCKCYAPLTSSCPTTEICKEFGGTCRHPDDALSANEVVLTGPDCGRPECQCYGPSIVITTCPLTDSCKAVGGTCRHPDEPRPDNEVEQDAECGLGLDGCKCFAPRETTPTPECTNKACTAADGLCVPPGGEVNTKFYSWKAGDWCDRETKCKCYKPKCQCTSKDCKAKCTKKKGKCFMSGMEIPAGYKETNYYCDKKLKCKCYQKR